MVSMLSKVQFSEVSINARFHLFIKRVGIFGGSLVMNINENCLIFYRVTTKSRSLVVI